MEEGLDKKSLEKVATNPKSSPEQKVTARILKNIKIQSKLSEVKDLYGSEIVEEFIKKSAERKKTKLLNPRLKRVKNKKIKKAADKISLKWVEEDNSDDDEGQRDPDDANSNEYDNSESVTVPKSKTKNVIIEKRVILNQTEDESEISKPELPKLNGTKESYGQNGFAKKIKPNKSKLNLEKSIDSFFVTSSGDNYLANVRNVDSDESDTEKPKPVNKKPRLETLEQRKPEISNVKKSFDQKVEEKQLHPSWIAKQNQKKIVLGVQGSKIKFGDDNETLASPAPIVKYVKQEDSADKLHPSWLAKQKQKQTIKEFQGTKIKFET